VAITPDKKQKVHAVRRSLTDEGRIQLRGEVGREYKTSGRVRRIEEKEGRLKSPKTGAEEGRIRVFQDDEWGVEPRGKAKIAISGGIRSGGSKKEGQAERTVGESRGR